MRDIPTEMAARIGSGAARLCHAWIVTRRDGTVAGFTDHDRDLMVQGVVCRAASGWTQGAGESAIGASPGGFAASGVLDDEAMSEADLADGIYDGAAVALWRVDWSAPALAVRLWSGRLARVRRDGTGFVADLEGPAAALDRVVGRTYGRDCDAILGDRRCGVDVDAFPGQGCDKRWSTCVGVFGNGINFQGFPGLPGDDFLTAYPAEGGTHDGGRR